MKNNERPLDHDTRPCVERSRVGRHGSRWFLTGCLALGVVAGTPGVGIGEPQVSEAPKPESERRPGAGVIVLMPVSDQTQDHLRLAATFVVTGDILAGSRLVATAILPYSGQRVVLRNFSPQPFSVHGGPCPGAVRPDLSECSTATSYPLTGFGLPTPSLPVGAVVEVSLRSGPTDGQVADFHIKTVESMRGIAQAGDGTITVFGRFNPTLPAEVYLGLYLRPFRQVAISVAADRIVVDPKNDAAMPRWTPDLYPVTVCQPGIGCDSLLLRLRLRP